VNNSGGSRLPWLACFILFRIELCSWLHLYYFMELRFAGVRVRPRCSLL